MATGPERPRGPARPCRAAIRFARTAAERADPLLSWNRPDERFFASGACHILAFRFVERHPHPDQSLIFVEPRHGLPGTHVFVRRDEWAFDFNGWNLEADLLAETHTACRELIDERWACDLVTVTGTLEAFCEASRSRRPDQFAHDPLPRADRYLATLPATPGTDRPISA